jgi:HSP20 family molecular chaperone IbpA
MESSALPEHHEEHHQDHHEEHHQEHHEHTITSSTTEGNHDESPSDLSGTPVALPIITLPDGSKELQITVEFNDTYELSDISVKASEHRIFITAVKQEKTDNRISTRTSKREYDLPDIVDARTIKAKLKKGNTLILTAPVKE